MKLFLFLCILSSIILISCQKDNNSCGYPISTIVAPASEQQALLDSLTFYGITDVTLDPSGFYYKVNNPGEGSTINSLCSIVAAYYRGGFLNGKGFDSTSNTQPFVFQLGVMIPGWQKGLSHVAKNGDIDLYIPPSLGYGAEPVCDADSNVVIPANSYLAFHVTISGIQ